MPHDMNGNILNEGDLVIIPAKVTSISPNDQFCNATFTSEMPPGTGMTTPLVVITNTRVCRLEIPPIAKPDGPMSTRFPYDAASDEKLARRFSLHLANEDQAARHCAIREKMLDTARFIRDRTPISPEQTRAFNALHEAMMLANAAIACNEA